MTGFTKIILGTLNHIVFWFSLKNDHSCRITDIFKKTYKLSVLLNYTTMTLVILFFFQMVELCEFLRLMYFSLVCTSLDKLKVQVVIAIEMSCSHQAKPMVDAKENFGISTLSDTSKMHFRNNYLFYRLFTLIVLESNVLQKLFD